MARLKYFITNFSKKDETDAVVVAARLSIKEGITTFFRDVAVAGLNIAGSAFLLVSVCRDVRVRLSTLISVFSPPKLSQELRLLLSLGGVLLSSLKLLRLLQFLSDVTSNFSCVSCFLSRASTRTSKPNKLATASSKFDLPEKFGRLSVALTFARFCIVVVTTVLKSVCTAKNEYCGWSTS